MRKKILFIGVFLALALILGIYLYPKEQPADVKQGIKTLVTTALDKNRANKKLKKEAMPAVSSTNQTPASDSSTDASSKANPYVFYPEKILELLGIDMEKMIAERDAFKNSVVHVEWMDRVNGVLKNLSPEKKEAIIQNHTSLLYMKDLLNRAYLTGKIDHETFVKAVADLMKWHQSTFAAMLTSAEYEALFEVKPEAAEAIIDDLMEATPKYGFILNQEIPVEEVEKQVQGFKLEQVDTHFKKMIFDREQIGKRINSGEMTLEQAREALHQSQQEFIARCKELLTEDEINTIFGSMEALETGGTQTEPPAVLGDSDVIELGFEIENPTTSIEMVKEKIDPGKREDIKFFYQQRAAEREALIDKLNAGEIREEEVENISDEMDAAFRENCKSVLSDAEYRLIFEKPEDVKTQTLGNADTSSAGKKMDEPSGTSSHNSTPSEVKQQ